MPRYMVEDAEPFEAKNIAAAKAAVEGLAMKDRPAGWSSKWQVHPTVNTWMLRLYNSRGTPTDLVILRRL